MFTENEHKYKCYICDRLWFLRDLKVASVTMAGYMVEHFLGENKTQELLQGMQKEEHLADEQIPSKLDPLTKWSSHH